MSKTDRRQFLRNITIGGSAVAAGLHSQDAYALNYPSLPDAVNMSGFAVPKMDKVRIGFIGLGMRGSDAVQRVSFIEGIEIKAICDKLKDRVEKSNQALVKSGLPAAKGYDGNDGWKAMLENEDLDLVYICTPWSLHTPMAVAAMKAGKNAATEVPAARTLDECWQLVETSEKTKKHCMMLENCCYDFFELLTLNMARNGMFGELVHAEGAYIHDLRSLNFAKDGYVDMWRLKENATRNGDLYPTHGLGPIAQCLNINRGDRMDHLVSMSTNDFQMGAMAKEKAATDDFYKPFADKKFRGNMNTTLIRTEKGKTIMVQHDVTSPRPYSRIHLISGTKGMAQKWPSPAKIAFGHEWVKAEEFKALEEKYTPPIVKHIGDIAKNVGGHGGMDFIMDWRLIDCLRNGLPLDQDVYDAALWSSIAPLSEASIAKRSRTVDVPDFTRGKWKTNTPHDLTLNGGGTTTVRAVNK
ncbi:Gfo/Idh/MocA family protein [Pollutibacter soli]|uniref:Gfo/Idh/MocA family protein n=1 Tax=Pollutibacter soli TaxID=3034157 RepID=UPI003013C901